MNKIKKEIKSIEWPTWSDISKQTLIVLMTIIPLSIFLSAFNGIIQYIISLII